MMLADPAQEFNAPSWVACGFGSLPEQGLALLKADCVIGLQGWTEMIRVTCWPVDVAGSV